MKILFLTGIVFILISCKAQDAGNLKPAKDNNSLLWQVSGNGLQQNSYLFGTFHLLCKADIHFSEELKKGIKNAKEMYLEMDMDDPSTVLGGLMFMNMKNDKTLKDLYTPEQYARLQRFFADSVGMPLNAMFSKMKPMLLESMLYPKMMPCKTVTGVEEELMKIAKENKKEIQGLETMAFQASIFDSIPYEEQAKELLSAVDSLDKNKKTFEKMLSVYKQQQLGQIQELFNDKDAGMAENQDILLDNRNKNWVEQLKTIMKKEPVFVAVGAGHLVGDKGLISLLKKAGYTVTPVDNR